ncbi:MAG TPA: PEP-CTERM sorting domain-containing protein, partial [Candidatus Obscuribacterales bacterium]
GIALVLPNNDLVPAGTYNWAVGSFSESVNFSLSATAILDEFTQVGGVGTVTSTLDGIWNNSIQYTSSDASPIAQVGDTIYVVVFNEADIASSNQFAIFNTGATFVSGGEFGNADITANAETAAKVVYGSVRGEANSDPGSFDFPASVALLPIPEPSTALLGGLGALLLLRRRRMD